MPLLNFISVLFIFNLKSILLLSFYLIDLYRFSIELEA